MCKCIIAVVFQTYGACAFFRMNLSELGNQKIVFADAEDKVLKELECRVVDALSDQVAIQLIEDFLLSRLVL